MNGPGHRILGAACALQFCNTTNQSVPLTIGIVLIASTTAHGRLSPDIDQYPIWRRRLSRIAPPGTRGHRYITHLWWWPAILGTITLIGWLPFKDSPTAGVIAAVPGSIVIGWLSHLLGDWLFGKARWQKRNGKLVCTQRAGIPMNPWGNHKGLGVFKVGRITERVTTAVTLPVTCGVQTFLLMGGHVYTLTTFAARLWAARHGA